MLDYLVDKQVCINIYGVEKLRVEKTEGSVNAPLCISRLKKTSTFSQGQMSQKVIQRRSTQLNLTPHQFNELKKMASINEVKEKDKKKKDGCNIF